MADNRKIVHGVVIGGVTVTDVDKLAELAPPEMLERLEKSGAITGDWESKAPVVEEAEVEAKDQPKAAPKKKKE